jgi:hypothetical protein
MASCVGLGAPATALAQGAPPAGAPVVAGPLADGTALVAFDRGDRLCVSLRGGEDAACNPPPDSALNAAVEWEWRRDRSLAHGARAPKRRLRGGRRTGALRRPCDPPRRRPLHAAPLAAGEPSVRLRHPDAGDRQRLKAGGGRSTAAGHASMMSDDL